MFYLDIVKQFLDEISANNSAIYKKEILEKYANEIQDPINPLYQLFHYVFDYDKNYYITSDNILKHYDDKVDYDLYQPDQTTLWGLLDTLSHRYKTGNDAIHYCIAFIKDNEQWKDLILKVIDKDLQIGITPTTINKIIPNFIPVYNVALANTYKEGKHKLDENWFIERKLDGVRCNLIYKNKDDIKCYSRQGKEFTTLQVLIDDVRGRLPDNTVLDGELCIVDNDGNENFQDVMKVIKRKNYTIASPMYQVFDMLTLDEFNKGKSDRLYKQRMDNLYAWHFINNGLQNVKVLNYVPYTTENRALWEKCVSMYGWEGLMFRKNVGYEAKRTNNLLKYKMWNDAEYTVKGVEYGDAQEVIDGIVHKINCVGSLVIEHKGCKVNVGTGLSLEQKKLWFVKPELIVGKQITVKYFEETQDQNGNWSLRFPVLKAVYEEQRDI